MDTAILHVRMLGGLDLRLGERPLPPLEGARVRSLLAWLLIHRATPQPRDRIAFTLWPDSSEAQARTNLRHVLHDLRRALPDPGRFLLVTPRSLQWNREAPFSFDVAAFETCTARAAATPDDGAVPLLRECVALYAGDLLDGVHDEWIDEDRRRLARLYATALDRLVAQLHRHGEIADAIAYARLLLDRDPLREDVWRTLMQLHDARGDRAGALHAFRSCEAALRRELDIEPSPATRVLHETLLRTRAAAPAATDAGTRDVALSNAAASNAAAAEATSRVHASSPPLIGRTDEWLHATRAWRAAGSGAPAMLFVTGEPGVGKTRLVEELHDWCVRNGAIAAVARSWAAEGALACAPVADWLRSRAMRPRLQRLDAARRAGLVRLLPELADAPVSLAEQAMPEDEARQRLFDAAAHVLLDGTEPVLLVLDDAHWADAETLRLIHYLLRRSDATRLLVAATARREELHRSAPLMDLFRGLRALGRITELELDRLSRGATADLAAALGSTTLEPADVDALFRETAGNPLFIIETLRAGWRPDQAGPAPVSPRVQAVIEFRLSRLSDRARELAGLAATIGRDFSPDLLVHAAGRDADSVARALDELWRSDIVSERRSGVYDFVHDRIREAAYALTGPAQRRHWHLRAARALKHLFAERIHEVSGTIAAHYDRAGVTVEAVAWYEAAAAAAQRVHAGSVAVGLLERALELVRTLPDGPDRDAREIALLTTMQAPLALVEGFSSHRLRGVHDRALELTGRLRVPPTPELLRSTAMASLTRSDFDTARESALQLRHRAEVDREPLLALESDYILGIAAFWQGRLRDARRHFEAAAGEHSDRLGEHLIRFGLDPRVICMSRLGNTMCLMGDVDSARHARDRALRTAAASGHADSRGTALVFAALMALDMDEPDLLRTFTAALNADPCNALQNRIGGSLFAGYLRVLDGDTAAGLADIRDLLHGLGDTEHAPGMRGFILRVLMDACALARDTHGRLDAAQRILAAGDAARLWHAEAHRARAECLARSGAPSAVVRQALEDGLAIARAQGAVLFERRILRTVSRPRGTP